MDPGQPEYRVAFVTCAAVPELSADDRLALPALQQRGISVTPVTWNDPRVGWEVFDLVVIRSTWDYTRRHAQFLAWLARMEQEQVPLWNAPAIARWNADKRYLRDLARAGVPTVPTRWIEAGGTITLSELMAAEGWTRAVVKPVVSANGQDTWITAARPDAVAERRFRALAAERALMVQAFVEEIRREGEWSFVFFAGAFSHALLKRPATKEFRVQEDYGGRTLAAIAPRELVEAARRALAVVSGSLLYARVDGVRVGDELLVMELELLEPSFFFTAAVPGARDAFADAILDTLRRRDALTARPEEA